MKASAERLDDGQVVQELGTVDEVAPELRVSTASGSYRAARAVSCVVAPEVGDTVLTAVSQTGHAWVLAILERPSEGPRRLSVEGDVELEASGGTLRIRADRDVEIRSPETVSVGSRRLELTAADARAFFERIGLAGGAARVDFEKVRSVVGLFDSVLERLSQRVKRSYRFVEEIDVTRAREIDTRAEETLQMRSRNTLMTSEGLTKVEADQIHLG